MTPSHCILIGSHTHTIILDTDWAKIMVDTTIITSTHSSRMRTTRLLPVSSNMHCSLGEALLPGGCLLPGGVYSGGVCLLLGGGLLLAAGGAFQHALRQTPPLVNRMTGRRVKTKPSQTSFAGGKYARRPLERRPSE